jgi:hypothetical protein
VSFVLPPAALFEEEKESEQLVACDEVTIHAYNID